MSEPISVGDGARLSLIQKLIQKLRQIAEHDIGDGLAPVPLELLTEAADALERGQMLHANALKHWEAAENDIPRWQPIETAPVKPWTPELAIYYRFDCLLQNERGDVGEGWAYYVPPRRGSTTGAKLRWANRIGQCFPILWMPLPPGILRACPEQAMSIRLAGVRHKLRHLTGRGRHPRGAPCIGPLRCALSGMLACAGARGLLRACLEDASGKRHRCRAPSACGSPTRRRPSNFQRPRLDGQDEAHRGARPRTRHLQSGFRCAGADRLAEHGRRPRCCLPSRSQLRLWRRHGVGLRGIPVVTISAHRATLRTQIGVDHIWSDQAVSRVMPHTPVAAGLLMGTAALAP
jgi:hypothetical protein